MFVPTTVKEGKSLHPVLEQKLKRGILLTRFCEHGILKMIGVRIRANVRSLRSGLRIRCERKGDDLGRRTTTCSASSVDTGDQGYGYGLAPFE